MAGTTQTPDAVTVSRTPFTHVSCSGPTARPLAGWDKTGLSNTTLTPRIKAIWLSEKGSA